MHYYEIAPTTISRRGISSYTYHSEATLSIGAIVHITLGRKPTHGIVVSATIKPPYDTKPIDSPHDTPPLPEALVNTALWLSTYYATPLATVLQTILPRGLDTKRRAFKKVAITPVRNRTNFVFNESQRAAIQTISTMTPGTALLHGVTGSGKTLVYIELARQMLDAGKSALILVPEIALTSQLVDEFSAHFPHILVAHSRQTEAERHHIWLTALTATAPYVVIGPRSALFIPIKHIGLIVVDECHETSYKQDQSPRYYAPRLAAVLASHHQANVVLGSATPPVSEYFLAEQHRRPVISMPTRAHPSPTAPTITLVDMTKRTHFRHHRFLSDHLIQSITQSLAGHHQTLIFHNRRGSASTTLCEHCGWIDLCPRCDIPRTLHTDSHLLRCHLCSQTARVPTSCPMCQSVGVIHRGIGTKLIETELRKLFPDARIARFDGDNSTDTTLDKRYGELYRGEIDIIIGTQVIAKGIDLPLLDTVGVIQADAGLSLPDFIAAERTFQLVSQVIGRVGRTDLPATAIVQSYQPAHPAITYGIAQDYSAFYHDTIAERRRYNYPPFSHLLRLTCSYKSEALTVAHAQQLAAQLRKSYNDSITLFGPTPSFYERQRDQYRWQIIVKSSNRALLLEIANHHVPATHWQCDIDPLSLL